MVIKLYKLEINILFCFIFLFSLNSSAEPFQIDAKKNTNESTEQNPFKSYDNLDDFTFDFTKVVNKSNKISSIIDLTELNNEMLNSKANNRILKPGEYVRVQDLDKKILLFDGTIQIKFASVPNFYDFADIHNLEFKTGLSEINRGIFKVKNVIDIEKKFNELKRDKNIIFIKLDTIDLTLKAQ